MGQLEHILAELKAHVPFTTFGAFVGVLVMGAICITTPSRDIETFGWVFHLFHPAHMLLSSIVTAAMFRKHWGGFLSSIGIGMLGSIPICMTSDIAFPYFGGMLLGASMTPHVCIFEHPSLVIPPAFVGAAIGTATRRWTKCPHAAHVLISTMASLFYLMAFGVVDWISRLPLVFALLFVAVWIPCCTSDVVFPLLFAKRESITKT